MNLIFFPHHFELFGVESGSRLFFVLFAFAMNFPGECKFRREQRTPVHYAQFAIVQHKHYLQPKNWCQQSVNDAKDRP